MYTAKDIILASRITNVVKLDSLDTDYTPKGIFSVLLAPKSGATAEKWDIVTFDAILPHSNTEYVEVPVVIGDWSPIVFKSIKANSIDLTDVDVYIAPIKDLVL